MIKKVISIIVFPLNLVFANIDVLPKNIFKDVDLAIKEDVNKGFGGAVLLVIKNNKVIKQTAYGYRDMFKPSCETSLDYSIPDSCLLDDSDRTPMTLDTIFDLASLTKVFATTFAAMHLVSQGDLELDVSVSTYIPEYPYDITVRQVAEHTSGLGPEIGFYNKNDIMHDGNTVGYNGFYSLDRVKTLDLITGSRNSKDTPEKIVPLEYETGDKNLYSDTGFMLLGNIIENIVKMDLDEYLEENIYKPLGINIVYNPLLKGIALNKIAQTSVGNWSVDEYGQKAPYEAMRTTPLQGEVNDEKAFYSLGGIAGHAGLFGSAKDLEVLIKVLLNEGSYNGITFFDKDTIDEFTSPSKTNDTHGIGWRLRGSDHKLSWMGDSASDKAYGHTGFTGMATVIDPVRDEGIILLTNKLQSQQTSRQKYVSTDKYLTPRYGPIISMVQKDIDRYIN